MKEEDENGEERSEVEYQEVGRLERGRKVGR